MTLRKVVDQFVRIAAGNPRPTSESGASDDGVDTKVNLADYSYLADLSPHAAQQLLQRFTKEAIRFEIGCDVTPPVESAVTGGCYPERRTISIYVHRDDFTKARQNSDLPGC